MKVDSSKTPNILLIISDQQRTDTLGFMGKTPCRTPNMDRLAQEGISYDRAICSSPLCSPSRVSIFTAKYPHQLDMLNNNSTLSEVPVITEVLKNKGYHTAYAGKWHLEPSGQPKAFIGREKELGLEKVNGGASAPKGERVVDNWFSKAAGQGSYDYSVWCEENGLPDGWTVSDPEVRTHRKPSMSIPRTKRMEGIDPSQTYDAWVTDIALQYLEERPKDQPFFLVTGWFGPHPPFYIPEPYYSMYDPDDVTMPPNFGPQANKPQANDTSYYRQLFKDQGEDWESWKKSMAVYWGYCTLIDDQVGRLIAALETEDILDDTLVIYISDHGEQLGSQGLWQKMMPYEEGLRVPMIFRLPKLIEPGLRSEATVSLIDIVPTILSIVGEQPTAAMQGRDLSPTFQDGQEFQPDAYRFSEHKPLGDWHHAVEWRLVVDKRFKYVCNESDMDELYDLQYDPYELVNLNDDPLFAAEKKRLQMRLERWMAETSDPLLNSFRSEWR